MDEEKFEEIVAKTGFDRETVGYILFEYDWTYKGEHDEWVNSADVSEIVGWMKAVWAADDWYLKKNGDEHE